jgi:hypothetical protein
MSKALAHGLGAAALVLVLNHSAAAQSSLQSTPAPTVTAENESWYLTGGPVTFGGTLYFPAGPITHFDRNDMVRTGVVGSTPVYARTTQEPGSIIYVPLAGGLMKPYERRRSGDLAGTVGSNAPSFTVILPAQESSQLASAGISGSTASVPAAVGTSGSVPAPAPAVAPEPATPAPVGTAGTILSSVARPARTRIQTLRRPVGLNSVFVDFQNARWFAAGPAVEFVPDRFTRVGEHQGFAVYQESGKTGTIYLSLLDGAPGLLAPYKSR